ncbi:11035_t:CDS:2 [Cetraspora pellucida]|uniref:11035_t:CDS:1 n=1 Tax=Cetraspora pellucida TaxID=1433469 RepID=A0ACA9MKD7_9GLOM|nr:11035_t:CDS:2 [Cetraspora pellucida]
MSKEKEIKIRHIIKKGKKTAEVQVWNEDKKNSADQTKGFKEEFKLQKKRNTENRSKQIELVLTRIKGYSEDIYNDIADSFTKKRAKNMYITEINNISIKNVKFIPEKKGFMLDTSLRTFVKRIVQLMYKTEWT